MFKKNKKIKLAAACLAAILAVSAFVGATSASGSEDTVEEVKKDIIVDTITPGTGDIVVTGEYIGTVEPSQQITIYPKASGEVLAVNFNVGDTVQAGDVLFTVDSKTLQTTIAQTQAAIASAKAKANQNLVIARSNLDMQEYNVEKGHDNTLKSASNAIDNAQSAVESAENRLFAANANLRTARRQLREFREDDIYPVSMAAMQGMLDEDQVEAQLRDAVIQAELSVEAAELGVHQAKDGLEKAKDGYKTAQVMVDEQRVSINNQIEMAKLNTNFQDQDIAIQKLQDDLKNFTITAPISGVIEKRSIEPYNMASPQAPAFVISDKDSMTVSFKIPKASYSHMKTGDQVKVENNGSTYMGTVTEISTMVDASGLFTIKASVANPPSDLFTGASVKVYADAQKAQNIVLIPLNALYYDNGAPFVYIAENGFVKKVSVEAGIYDAQNIQIMSGVSKSDKIISTWSSGLADGVEIVLASEAGSVSSADVSNDAAGEEIGK